MSHAHSLKHTLIGDRAFYKRVVAVLVPIIIQNTVTNVVSLLDNVMVGSVGTIQMSAVAIVNQLLFIFNLCIFGGLAGAGIFVVQYACLLYTSLRRSGSEPEKRARCHSRAQRGGQ